MKPKINTAPAMRQRTIKDGPFCWVSKKALRTIREVFDDVEYLDQAVAVYLAHAEVASDEMADTYERTLRRIAHASGVSRRQVARIHERLRQVKLLHWDTIKYDGTEGNAGNSYTLLSVETPSATRALGSATRALPSASDENGNLAYYREPFKKNPKEALKKGQSLVSGGLGADFVPLDTEDEFISACRSLFAKGEMDKYGGAWRTRYRAYPDKCRRVMRECLRALKEGESVKSWAAYANDVHGRFK